MRWLGTLARIVGWLLMPLVAWAASLSAGWILLTFSDHFDHPRRALYFALAGAFVTGVVILFGWMLLLRRSPRLRHSLHVTPEGLPELEPDVADPPDMAPTTPPSDPQP
ncbi:MAG: hypothetical protein ABI587_06295 [Gemmatimonadales bacterium]